MKKLIVIALAVVMAFAVVAFAACGGSETVTGEYSYKYSETTTYGVKVDVTVKNGVITAVKMYTEEETGWVRTSSGWKPTSEGGWGMNEGDLGHDATEAAYSDFLACFEGLTVEEVKAIKVNCKANGEPEIMSNNGITGAPSSLKLLAGATQSCGRIILAVQNALSQLGK